MVRHQVEALRGDNSLGHLFALTNLKNWFEIFLERSTNTTWKAARGRAQQLLDIIAEKIADDGSPKFELAEEVSRTYLDRTLNVIKAFESTLASECMNANVFAISRKGTHDSMALMDAADDNLPPDTRGRLSPEIIRDLREAGKCLALDCHTASGYHILRAVERVIIKYVEKVTGKTYGLKNRNWGAYIKVLQNCGADVSVIGYIDHMRLFYRNPIIHPDQTLDANDALSLFNASLSAIIQLDAAIQAWP